MVVVTGGLGPTHDDVTREAASRALGKSLQRDPDIEKGLRAGADRHTDARSASQVYGQADVIEGARVLPAITGTAPGLVVPTGRGALVLLPGPPREMRPMLASLAAEWGTGASAPAVLRCVGLLESDAQYAAQDVLAQREDVVLTVLAAPGDLRVVLHDRGAGAATLAELTSGIAARLGPACYSSDGSSLAATVLRLARERGERIATAESCTGGLVAGAITEIPGSSDSFVGGIVAYSNATKTALLGVDERLLSVHGAVSEPVACAMAEGALRALGADWAVSVTGIAGPDGGSPDKPVGTVWFAVAGAAGTRATHRMIPGARDSIRTRSTVTALDLLRRALAGL